MVFQACSEFSTVVIRDTKISICTSFFNPVSYFLGYTYAKFVKGNGCFEMSKTVENVPKITVSTCSLSQSCLLPLWPSFDGIHSVPRLGGIFQGCGNSCLYYHWHILPQPCLIILWQFLDGVHGSLRLFGILRGCDNICLHCHTRVLFEPDSYFFGNFKIEFMVP